MNHSARLLAVVPAMVIMLLGCMPKSRGNATEVDWRLRFSQASETMRAMRPNDTLPTPHILTLTVREQIATRARQEFLEGKPRDDSALWQPGDIAYDDEYFMIWMHKKTPNIGYSCLVILKRQTLERVEIICFG